MCADIVSIKIPYNTTKKYWQNSITPDATMYDVSFLEYRLFFGKTSNGWYGQVCKAPAYAKRNLNIPGFSRGEKQKWEMFGDDIISFIQDFIDDIIDALTDDYYVSEDSDDYS